MCSLGKILTLGINSEMTYREIFNLIAPFSNEIANILTISGVYNVYAHVPKTPNEKMLVVMFDLVGLVGICSNVAYTTQKYNFNFGLMKGILLILFSFTIPNFFMYDTLKGYNDRTKLALGLIIVYFLDVYLNAALCLLKPILYNEEKENEKTLKKLIKKVE